MTRPDVILILADDLGWGDVSCYGAEAIQTPAIDMLAARGARFTDAHAAAAVCTPSRYALQTGRYSWRGPLKRGVLGPHGPALIEPGRPTIASVLRDAGYRTGAFGKWHLGLGWMQKSGERIDLTNGDLNWSPKGSPEPDIDYGVPVTGGPTELGYDTFFGTAGSLDMPPYAFLEDDRIVGTPDREKKLVGNQRPGMTTADWSDEDVDLSATDRALQWIQAQKDPYFCYIATAAPHRPYVPPAALRGSTQAGVRGDCVRVVDWVVERVINQLTVAGKLDQTLVIIASDNGADERFLEPGDTHDPNGPWRGQKADIWEGGHRVPLIVHWPDRIAPQTVDTPVVLTDLLPTIASAAHAQLPEGAAEDGQDLMPHLDGLSHDLPRPIIHHADDGSFALRQGSLKAIYTSGSGGFTAPRAEPTQHVAQLYDLVSDPGELHNLVGAPPISLDTFQYPGTGALLAPRSLA